MLVFLMFFYVDFDLLKINEDCCCLYFFGNSGRRRSLSDEYLDKGTDDKEGAKLKSASEAA